MDECVFCKIFSGEISSHKVYEDEYTVAILDKHPINPGHVLVIPKSHESDFYNLEDDLYQKAMSVVKRLSRTVQEIMKPKKVGLVIAGWDVPHTHIHIIPMHDYHDITSKSLLEGTQSNPTDEELVEIADKLRK